MNYLTAALTGGAIGLYGKYRQRQDQKNESALQAQRYNETQRAIQIGMEEGRNRGRALYGQSMGETGLDMQDILNRRKQALGQNDPRLQAMKAEGSRAESRLKAGQRQKGIQGSLALQQQEQLKRNVSADIQRNKFMFDQENLNAYQRMVGNMANAQAQLEMGYGGLRVGALPAAVPRNQQGIISSALGGIL